MDDWVVGIDLGAKKIELGLVRPESLGAAGERIAARDRFPIAPAAGPGALDKFVLLLRGFCALKIPHIQFNVVVAETLRRAQARPEDYPSLLVRVAGYSVYFTELDRGLQDKIIARTEYADSA
jgi:hypothetical protein